MLNINYGHNQKLLEQCQPLYEYAHFIKLVREYSEMIELRKDIDIAIEKAKDWECIGTFLYQCKSEVSVMLLTEFDQKSYDNGLIKVGVEKERYEKMCEMLTMNFPVESIAKLYKVPVDYVLDFKKNLENNKGR